MENKLMKLLTQNGYALVEIEPKHNLELVAQKLENVFDGLSLNISHSYDEFPAFVGSCNKFNFVLLGIPTEGEDILGRKIDNYQLEIFFDGRKIDELTDESDLIAKFLTEAIGVKCKVVD